MASGQSAAVFGGGADTSTGGNQATGAYSVVSGGGANTASGERASVYGGTSNSVDGAKASIFGGYNNQISNALSSGKTGENATIVGGSSNLVTGNYSIAVGGNDNTVTGSQAAAIGGTYGVVQGMGSTGIGGGSTGTDATYAVAIGDGASANAMDAVAIGYQAVASAENTISVGHKAGDTYYTASDGVATALQYESDGYNRIVNMADGTSAHDAATVGQTVEIQAGSGIAVDASTTNASGQKIVKISSNGLAINSTNTWTNHDGLDTDGTTVRTTEANESMVSGGRYNWANGNFSSVSGGYNNKADGENASISGGEENQATALNASVSGGNKNVASGNSSSVSGGQSNTAGGELSSVSGGVKNTASASGASVSGGYGNQATEANSSILGGSTNTASGRNATVSGGYGNTAGGVNASILGGQNNTASGLSSTVGGGSSNQATGSYASVVGGIYNVASGKHAAVVGGGASYVTSANNTASGDYSVVIGGASNKAAGVSSSIFGGTGNKTTAYANDASASTYASVFGGSNNTASGMNSVATGGFGNKANGKTTVVVGGQTNTADGSHSVLIGGQLNNLTSDANYAGLLSGYSNTVSATYSTVVGGRNNSVTGTGAVIAGGRNNVAGGIDSVVSGGYHNVTVKGANSQDYGVETTKDYSYAAGGRNSVVQGQYSTGLAGGSTSSDATDAVAIGSGASANVANGVAIGYQAVATEANTISVGHKSGDTYYTYSGSVSTQQYGSDVYNRIVNVADGTSAHDAATLEQVPLIEAGDNITITADGTDATTGQTKYKISGVVEKEIAGQVLLTGSGINTATGTNATVTGGQGNQATGNYASVSGGSYNTAEGESSVVAGGYYGKATGKYAGIYGGGQSSGSAGANTASGDYSVVSGGWGNTASGTDASVFGGVTNTAAGKNSVIVGGNGNNVTSAANQSSDSAVIVGGSGNTVSGIASTIVGGYRGTASGKNSTIVGGSFNKASGTNATTVGGSLNTATGTYASVFGGGNAGNGNTASGDYSVVSGGWGNTASGTQASIYGGVGNKAAGSLSSIYGGSYNTINAVSESDTGTITGGFKNAISGGHDASILGGSYNTAKGNYSTITGGSYNQVVGEYALAAGGSRNIAGGSKSVALGGGSEGYNGNIANGSRSTVIGGSSNYTIGANSTALGGYHSIVQGQYSTGIGGGSTGPNASYGVAVGPSSVVTVSNGTAVGFQSTASKEGTVSFGHNVGDVSGYSINWNKNADGSYDYTTAPTITEQTYSSAVYNRLVNVGYGKDGHDAATMDQLTKVAAGDRVTVTSSKDATTGATTYTVSANNDGSVALGDTNLVSGGTVYSEVRPGTDGTYVKTANTTGANLTALDTQVKTNADDITVLKEGIYVSVNGAEEKANLKAGDTLNLAAGDNAVLTADTANRKVTIGVSKTPVFDSVETKSLKLGDTAKTDVTYDGDRIQYTAGTVTKSLATTDDGLNFKVGDQTLSQKLNSTLEVAAGDNVTVTGTDGKITISAVDTKYTAGDHIAISSDNQISARVDGSVASGNADIVSGGTVYSEVRPESDGNYIRTGNTTGANLTALDTQVKANADQISTNTTNITNLTNLSNITNEGETVIRNLAKGSVKVVDGTNTTVTTGTDGDATTYAVNVSNDSIKEAVADDLAKKANVDASNIGTYLTDEATKEANLSAWGTALGTGSVASGNGQLVTGGTVYSEVRPAADGNYIRTVNTTGANLTALDQQVKTNADQINTNTTQISTNTTNITNLTNLSNITNEGETVIRNLAKGSVKVVDGTNTTVTTGTEGDATTYAVNVSNDSIKEAVADDLAKKANVDASNIGTHLTDEATKEANLSAWGTALGTGSVASGNGQLVTGGTVYSEVRPAADGNYIRTANTTGANLTALDQQVGTNTTNITNLTNLSNITNEGETVIKNLAKGAVKVAAGTNVTVSDTTDAEGGVTYTVAAQSDGQVAQNDTKLVTGDTVYNYVKNLTDQNTTDLANKANVDASNIGTHLEGDAAQTNLNAWGSALGTGSIASDNGQLVTGGTVHAYETPTLVTGQSEFYYINSGYTTGQNLASLDKQVHTNADDITNLTTKVNNIKVGTVKLTNGTNTTVESQEDTTTNTTTYQVNVASSAIRDAVKEDLDKKANVDASNVGNNLKDAAGNAATSEQVTDNLNAWGSALGGGTITSDSQQLVTGKTVHDEVRPASDGNYIRTANTTGANLTALDSQVKSNTDQITTNTTNITNLNTTINNLGDTYAKTDLTNITTGGQTVIKNLAKDAVKVVAGTNTTVTEGADGEARTYAVNVSDEAIKNVVADDLNGKANVDASNVSGDNIGKWQTKLGNGTISSGNTGLVTGDTIHAYETPTLVAGQTELHYVKSDYTTGENLAALDQQVHTNAGDITNLTTKVNNIKVGTVKLEDGINTTVEHTEDTATNTTTYKVNVSTQAIQDAVKTDLSGKANINASNIGNNLKDSEGMGAATSEQITANLNAWGSALGTGSVASGNGQLVTGGTVYSEVRPSADGNYVKTAETTGSNLLALDRQVKSNAGDITTINTTINNLGDTYAKTDLSNITNEGNTVIKNLAKGAVKVTQGDRVTVTSSENSTDGSITYTVSANNNGVVAENNTDLVSGDTVYKAIKDAKDAASTDVDGKLANKANVDASNIGTHIADETARKTNLNAWGETIGTGSVTNVEADGANQLVTGGTVYSEVRPASDGNYIRTANTTGANLTALDTQVKANADQIGSNTTQISTNTTNITNLTNLSNITNQGETVIKNLAKDAVKVVNGTNTTVTTGTDGDATTYAVNVSKEAIEGAVSEDLAKKANVDASNVGSHIADATAKETNLNAWGEAIGTGSVASGNGQLVTGGTVYSEVRPASDGNYIRTASTTGANLTALDTQVKANADQIGTNTTNITNLTNLSNITNEGETVIKNLAKGAVKVVDGTNTTVTTGADGDATTYAVNVSKEAIEGAVSEDMAKKANVDASNVGSHIADATAKETNLNDWGTALGTGSVASGNGQLVTGGTVYSEVRPASDGNYIRTASTTGANLTALDTQVKANADQIGTNTTNITNLTNLSNITNEGETVIKNLAKGAVKVAAGTNISVTDSTGTDGAVTYTVAAQSDGQVAQNDTKLVTGDTVYNYVKNLTDQNTTDLANKANVDASNVTGDNIGKWQSVLGTGSVANGNTGLVTGGTIFTYVTPVAASGQTFRYISTNRTTGENLAALDQQVGTNADSITTINTTINNLGDTYAKTDLSNITDNGRTVIKNLAKGSISMENGSHTTVSKRDVNGVDTYKVDVDTSGTVTSGNTGIVTGGTVYDAIQAIKDETNVSNKANVDASNIGKNLKKADGTAASESEQKANAESWGDAIGTGKVENGDKRLVTGDTVSRAIQDETRVSENGNYITTDTSAADNLKKLDSQVKTNADNITNNTTAINNIKNITDNLDANYAKTDLTNITTAGETKIKNLAQDAVKVVNGNNTTVRTISGTDGNISYAVDVSDADIKNVMKEDMDKKADRNAGNLTDSDVTAWQNKLGTGESRSGDHRLINGDTLYNALSQIDGDSLVETNGVTINIDKDGTAKTIDIHGKDGSLRTITSVATNPSDPTSAANVDYVDHRVQSLNNRLTQDISRVGAGAAALAALHPLEYDPNNEFEFAVGYGHYKVANAAAMGVFYRPSRAAMYSFGGTLGNGDAMFNAGVTFRFGGPRHVEATPMSTSNVLSAQTERIQQQDALIQTQNQQIHQQNMKIDQLEKELIELKRMIMKKA